jgi:hypothetical protein
MQKELKLRVINRKKQKKKHRIQDTKNKNMTISKKYNKHKPFNYT